MKDFPLYLDANAHQPTHPTALQAYCDFQNSVAAHGHPSSLSAPGQAAALKLEESRAEIARLIGAKAPGQIIFTSTCTQAAEWGMKIFQDIQSDSPQAAYAGPHSFYTPAISSLEHSAISQAAKKTFATHPLPHLHHDSNGLVNWKYQQLPGHQAAKIICVHLQNELGTIQPIKELKSTCQYLFADLSQSLGKIPVNVQDLDVDVAIFSAHKFGGPASLGWLYLKNVQHWSSFGSGSRYFLDRPGTPDVGSVVATVAALQEALKTLPSRTIKMREFQTELESYLLSKEIEVVGLEPHKEPFHKLYRSPNTTFLYLPNKGAHLLLQLGQKGIHVGLGSACGSMHSGPSPTIKALGRTGDAQDYLRISQFGDYGKQEAQRLIKVLDKLL